MKAFEGIVEDLARFKGGVARLHDYTASHDRLVIRIDSKDGKQSAILTLLGCSRLSMPTLWKMESPEIDDSGEWKYRFVDKGVLVDFAYEATFQEVYDKS